MAHISVQFSQSLPHNRNPPNKARMSSFNVAVHMSACAALLLLTLVHRFGVSEAGVFQVRLTEGETLRIDQVPGTLVVRRVTSAHKDPQYLFAEDVEHPHRGGYFTTNGKNKVGHGNARLTWSGELVVEHVTAEDAGEYTFPTERPANPHLPSTQMIVTVMKKGETAE